MVNWIPDVETPGYFRLSLWDVAPDLSPERAGHGGSGSIFGVMNGGWGGVVCG